MCAPRATTLLLCVLVVSLKHCLVGHPVRGLLAPPPIGPLPLPLHLEEGLAPLRRLRIVVQAPTFRSGLAARRTMQIQCPRLIRAGEGPAGRGGGARVKVENAEYYRGKKVSDGRLRMDTADAGQNNSRPGLARCRSTE